MKLVLLSRQDAQGTVAGNNHEKLYESPAWDGIT